MFDYRFRSFYDNALQLQRYAKDRADTRKAKRETDDGADEIAIARYEGQSEAYAWITDQLKAMEHELPTAGAQPGDPVAKQGDTGVNVPQLARSLRDHFNAMCREASNYGWNDSDCQRLKSSTEDYIRQLRDALDTR